MKNRIMVKVVVLIFCLSVVACRPFDAQLKKALAMAKNNRPELEKVLEHYRDDSLKLEAAEFLIRNMPGHYSLKDTVLVSRYYNTVDSIVNAMDSLPMNIVKDSLESMTNRFPSEIIFDSIPDLEIITADYLIKNIDEAFRLWKEGAWAVHLNFDQFCEFILPYKGEDLRFLDGWRKYLQEPFGQRLDELQYCELYKHSAIAAASLVNDNLRNGIRPWITSSFIHPVYRLSTKSHLSFGVCDDFTEVSTAVFRSHGIPVATDFTPQWPFQSQGHSWNVLLSNDRKMIPFEGMGSNPGEPHVLYDRTAKVFRRCYAINPEIERLLKTETFVPAPFQSPFLKDVSEEYMECVDVEVEVRNKKDGYVYLAVFDNRSWIPVAFAPVKKGKACFKAMGRDIAYLPVYYDEWGFQKVAGTPFLLTYQRVVEQMKADTLERQSVVLYRKYPLMPHVHEVAWRVLGGEFQAADNPSFRNARLVHRIEEWGTAGREVDVPDSVGAYRYWRYFQSKENSYCNMAEICFKEKQTGKFIEGKIIGTDGALRGAPADKTKVFDHDLLTSFDSPFPSGSWVGMDFGKPVCLEQIIYTGRGDGNTIDIGDTYELFYWDENEGWVSLGKQKATTVKLEYHHVPAGTLYWLRDLTKGQEERIFTYEDGEQNWW